MIPPRNKRNRNWFRQQFVVREDDGLHEYLEEYENIIKQRESKRIVFHHRSIQLNFRESLVDYLRSCINDYYLSAYCLHLAIYLLDITMDNCYIYPLQLHLLANSCLLLAVKCEEIQYKIPEISKLNEGAQSNYSKLEYKTIEVSILQLFDWYLLIPTAVHFVQYYMTQVIDEYDVNNNYYQRSGNDLIHQIKRKVSKYLYEIVDDFHYINNFPPSQQAAAIIFAARKKTGLKGWSPQLHRFTGYRKRQLQAPLNILFKDKLYCYICSNQNNYNHVDLNKQSMVPN